MINIYNVRCSNILEFMKDKKISVWITIRDKIILSGESKDFECKITKPRQIVVLILSYSRLLYKKVLSVSVR